jgi:hypothetical protein
MERILFSRVFFFFLSALTMPELRELKGSHRTSLVWNKPKKCDNFGASRRMSFEMTQASSLKLQALPFNYLRIKSRSLGRAYFLTTSLGLGMNERCESHSEERSATLFESPI